MSLDQLQKLGLSHRPSGRSLAQQKLPIAKPAPRSLKNRDTISTVMLKTSEEPKEQQSIYVREHQSQKLIQELISAAIGCVTYLRGLIPESSFCDMKYGTALEESRPQARGLITCHDSARARAKKESGTRIKSIQRGRSQEADTLLDWIEKGVFSALDKGYLRAFQLAVFLDPENPDLIQEAYTFSVGYQARGNGECGAAAEGIAISDIILNGESYACASEVLDATQIRRSVKALIRRLIVVTQNLDLLPENRYLTIRLYHTPDTPEDWVPPLFTSSFGKQLWFDSKPNKSLNDEIFGTVETNAHSIQIRVTSKKRCFSEIQGDAGDTTGSLVLAKRPKNEDGTRIDRLIGLRGLAIKISSRSNGEFQTLLETEAMQVESEHRNDKKNASGKRTTLGEWGDTARVYPMPQPLQLLRKQGDQGHFPKDQVSLSIRGGSPGNSAFWNQVKSKPKQREGTVSSGVSHLQSTRSQGSEVSVEGWGSLQAKQERIQSFMDIVTKTSNADAKDINQQGANSEIIKLHLSEHKLRELGLLGRTYVDSLRGGSCREKTTQINYECGSVSESTDTIQCDICYTWQHCECYGFTGDDDQRIGEFHICYTCLLGKNESHLTQQMINFTIARKLVRYLIRARAAKTIHQIAKAIGLHQLQISSIILDLLARGYIDVVDSRKMQTLICPSKYKFTEEKDIIRCVEEDLLDPLINISHHYKLGVAKKRAELGPKRS
ncbi:DNA binding protein [Orbilia ellipsospora]|uniref:DNA binding protein n=1 Tax=Orbilia ellipsospora TaxID=2528407 RepID=A0AAV9XGQ1_9PEZI